MNVEISEVEAQMILDALSRPASERLSPRQAGTRAAIKRKMRVIVAGPSPELTKALDTLIGDRGGES